MPTTDRFTGKIKLRGWKVKDALKYWGRSYSWFHRNCNGTDEQQIRLDCMCKGLEDKPL